MVCRHRYLPSRHSRSAGTTFPLATGWSTERYANVASKNPLCRCAPFLGAQHLEGHPLQKITVKICQIFATSMVGSYQWVSNIGTHGILLVYQ